MTSSFPAYVGLGENLSLGSTLTPASASSGTYSWTKVTGPGTVTFSPSASDPDPDFSADQPGNYTVEVEYTKGGATASDTSGTITVFKVEIDTPSSFPAYVGLGENLSLGSTLTPASAGGGTYIWSKVTGPGTVTFSPSTNDPDPDFSANQVGDYTVRVQYTKEEATADDTSGTITVVEVDLDISGVNDEDEEYPGGYVGVNNDDDNSNDTLDKDESGTVSGEDDLVSISLSISPSSLDEGQAKLEATSGSSKIKVWESSTKGTEVTLPKTWDLSSESVPATLYVEGIVKSDQSSFCRL